MFWDILPEIFSSILWHENAIVDLKKKNHIFKRGHEIFY